MKAFKAFFPWLRGRFLTVLHLQITEIFIAVLVGLVASLAALILSALIDLFSGFSSGYRNNLFSIFFPAAGAGLAIFFMEKIAREGAGHGIPELIYAVSRHGGLVRMRSAFSRIIASAITIGSGGSVGPEAPVAMSGGSIGSNIGRLLKVDESRRAMLLGCGAASAIGSIFNAPVAGMVFTMEVIFGQWRSHNLVPVIIAAVAGTELSRSLQGNQIPFDNPGFSLQLHDTLACIGLAVLAGFLAICFARCIRGMGGLASKTAVKFSLSPWTKAAIGGLFVGLIGFLFPDVLGEGYHAIREMITGRYQAGISLLLLVLFAKILATSLTLGWGGVGGLFAPSLVLGALTGIFYHRLLVLLFPEIAWVDEGCFALLGMAGFLAAIMQAPLTGIFLISEITGGYAVMLPLMLVSALSTIIFKKGEETSVYLRDLLARGEVLRLGSDGRVLKDMRISEIMENDCITIHSHMLLRSFIEVVKYANRNYFPVLDTATGRFLGTVHLDDVRPFLFDEFMYDTIFMEQLMNRDVEVVHPDDELRDVLEIMDEKGLYSMPVVANHRFVGMISKATLLDQYRKELRVQTAET